MILVTGATGLVGSHLLVLLLEKHKSVRALYRRIEGIEKTKSVFRYKNKLHLFENIEWVEADILDIPKLSMAFEHVETIYHCAAYISFNPADEQKLRKTNIEGTANVVNCCIDFKVKKLCYVSSIAALGTAKEPDLMVDETADWNPEKYHSDYAISKYGAEMEVWRGFQEGLEVVVVNPGVIFGFSSFDTGSGLFFKALQNGLLFFTKGNIAIVAVEDVVYCMQQLTESNCNGEKFILVAENISYKNMFSIIADGLGAVKPRFFVSKLWTTIAWKLDTLASVIGIKKSSFSKSTANAAHAVEWFSNVKLKEHLSFNFTNMKTYLEDLCKVYLSRQIKIS
ncbi:MAG TPA: NAD-dependent epimerase [Flavobacterium sp.]|nr:NAD-dependent epimerase [Flavobacterium sp.]